MRYRADITAGSLKLRESRVIADLLLRGLNSDQWDNVLYEQNVLQARTPKTAERLVQLLKPRLETMGPDLWRLIANGGLEVATHACLAAAVKHSPLLGDFLDTVIREQYELRNTSITRASWNRYIEQCQARDPDMPNWAESTIDRLRSSVFQILAQAGYLENTRSLRLQTVHIASQVLRYLRDNEENYVLRCIQVRP